jgi:hypothetical protein
MDPVALHSPVAGSKSSAEASTCFSQQSETPPAARTRPSGSRVVENSVRAVSRLPVVRHAPAPADAWTVGPTVPTGAEADVVEKSPGGVDLGGVLVQALAARSGIMATTAGQRDR